jgi:hypothetical protein
LLPLPLKAKSMDQLFSFECKSLIAKSREIAITLGYDYISTIHIFLADCETDYPTSVKKFAFDNEDAYIKFKKDYTLPVVNYLDNINDSLPLTVEAESAIRLAQKEMEVTGFTVTCPFHILLGCLKAEHSVLAECFKTDKDVVENLMQYYRESGAFEQRTKALTVTKRLNLFRSFVKIFSK